MTKYWEKDIMKKSTQVKKKKTKKYICIKGYVTMASAHDVGDVKSFMKNPDLNYWAELNMDQLMEINDEEVYY
jgi:hypothetical protein